MRENNQNHSIKLNLSRVNMSFTYLNYMESSETGNRKHEKKGKNIN